MTLTVDQYKEILARKRRQKRSPQIDLLEEEAKRQSRQARRSGFVKAAELSESQIQQQGVAIARNRLKRYGVPAELLYAVPNGANVTETHRMRLVSEGLMPGWPDLNLDWPSGDYHGLRIEVKKPGGRLGERQKMISRSIGQAGYAWTVAWSIDEIVDKVISYVTRGYP